MRDARKADIAQRLSSVNAQMEDINGEETSESEEVEEEVMKESIWQNHFEDAEKMTTVTVIEDFEQTGLENFAALESNDEKVTTSPTKPPESKVPTVPTVPKKNPESKKKAFRYGTKAERKSDRKKAKLKKVQNKSRHKHK